MPVGAARVETAVEIALDRSTMEPRKLCDFRGVELAEGRDRERAPGVEVGVAVAVEDLGGVVGSSSITVVTASSVGLSAAVSEKRKTSLNGGLFQNGPSPAHNDEAVAPLIPDGFLFRTF